MKARIQKFCEERNWDQYHGLKDLSIGITTESAELLELLRFKTNEEIEKRLKEDKEFRTKVEDELADVLYFVLRASQKYEFDLSDALETKMKKNEEKYPVSKVYGSNKKYSER